MREKKAWSERSVLLRFSMSTSSLSSAFPKQKVNNSWSSFRTNGPGIFAIKFSRSHCTLTYICIHSSGKTLITLDNVNNAVILISRVAPEVEYNYLQKDAVFSANNFNAWAFFMWYTFVLEESSLAEKYEMWSNFNNGQYKFLVKTGLIKITNCKCSQQTGECLIALIKSE